jgi:hypothetical protein
VISRNEWNARQPTGTYGWMPPTPKGVKIHYVGSYVDPKLLTDHGRCVSAVKGIQNGHMDGNGWIDIGYSFIVCPHRKMFEGRGIGHIPAANGSGLNSGHYAVLALVGNAGLTEPNQAMIEGLRDAIAYIRKYGNAGNEIKGHRDGYATDCPGGSLYALVNSGMLEPNNRTEDDDMPSYLSIGLNEGDHIELQPGDWTTLVFDVEFSDPDNQHSSGRFPSFLSGKCRFSTTVHARVSGLARGVEGQIRLYEVNADNKRVKVYPIAEWSASEGDTFITHTSVGTVDEGNKLRAELVHFGGTAGIVETCSVKALYWH